jgi:hypothetical protein
VQEVIDRAKAEFLQAKGGLFRALDTTADDRINWSPSETARSPLHIVAHAGIGGRAMLGNLKGDTFSIPTTEEAHRYFRGTEMEYTSRDQVERLWDGLVRDYFAWLDQLTSECLESMMDLPFGLGSMPISMGIAVMAMHINWHTAQIHYIQTIYGDYDSHL